MTRLYLKGVTLLSAALPMAFAQSAYAQEITHKVSGRVMIDYSIVDADNANMDWSASELRRARLGVSGNIGDTVKYKVEFNTNSSQDINVEDAYLQWAPTGGKWNIKAGQFKTANSLDEQTSSRFISALERSAFTDAFEFNRRVGVSVNGSGETYTFSAGVFGDNLTVGATDEGKAAAARFTYTPYVSGNDVVHLGASWRYREAGDDQSDLRYRQRTSSHIPGRIISTGRVADRDNFLGAEAAGIMGNGWAAGEYGVLTAQCTSCTDDPSFGGGYIEAGYIFGGRRTYKGGKFNRPKVDTPVTDGGMGAIAIMARYDTLDLSDNSVNGGDIEAVILGADWYATKYTRLGINYFTNSATLGTSTSGLDPAFAALVANNVTGEDVSGVNMRLQFDF
ncbi:OprO/OprP family phosphate-selective porin [Robiginitomaculum antarcticum]|uniref:OprO/OprP family phosphate-selective porin n=1 Tax=Robiginitomaculum antarcticum TaxID=437507 RepID=UPI000374CE12|nr:porin [Robiginitomaculum antarcticum]